MEQPHSAEPQGAALLKIIGPGLVVAATGVGAGDLVAAAKAGATFSFVVLWVAIVGAVLKYSLTEGIARWQLATGTTVLEGWVRLLGWPVRAYVLLYLVVWTVIVAAALMSACGLAAHALAPALSVRTWAMVHGVMAMALVWCEHYGAFERTMKWAIGLMFVTIVGSALLQRPPMAEVLLGALVPRVPVGGTVLVAGAIGGVGGTLTLLSYGYWIREKGWCGPQWMRAVRVDLAVGYGLTGVFGVALIVLGAAVLHPLGIEVAGAKAVVEMSQMLAGSLGSVGSLVFLVGFWAAVASSIVGVWHGVPYLFAHWMALLQRGDAAPPGTRAATYRWYLAAMTFLPMALLLLDRPVWLVVAYAALGSLFMPFLAATLLVLNNQASDLGLLRNGWLANAGLIFCLLLFAALAVVELGRRLGG